MRTYRDRGRGYLVCPQLLKLDRRHGDHPDRWPPCRRGEACSLRHEHEPQLVDPEGHAVTLFVWVPGSLPPRPADIAPCPCGSKLVWTDLDNPGDSRHLRPEPEPPGVNHGG